ncbi:MAG: hypothetical protein K2W82_13490 [Candidatus Obscuribacterales bacterium]|nr:hypothetical protein [Candidatus Obscuribacterales bacterium]
MALPAVAQDNSAPAVPLTTGVHKVELTLEVLRDVGLDLKHLVTAAGRLHDEVSIQPVTLQTEPEVVGMGTIIYIPIGTTPVGPPAPPRKDRLDMAMSQLTPQINIMKKNVDDFVSGKDQLDLPDDVLAELQPMTSEWVTLVNDVYAQLQKVLPLVQGPTYDNAAIAAQAIAIQQDAQKLETLRHKIYKIIRKEGSRAAGHGK